MERYIFNSRFGCYIINFYKKINKYAKNFNIIIFYVSYVINRKNIFQIKMIASSLLGTYKMCYKAKIKPP